MRLVMSDVLVNTLADVPNVIDTRMARPRLPGGARHAAVEIRLAGTQRGDVHARAMPLVPRRHEPNHQGRAR